MKKLFISQPMKGKTDDEILKERAKAIARENARGCRIENTCAIEYGIAVIEDYTED